SLQDDPRPNELATAVHEGRPATDGVGADDGALDELVRVPFDQLAVAEGAGLALVEVHHDVHGLSGVLRDEGPFLPGGEPGPAPPAQTGALDLLDHCGRIHGERLAQPPVAARPFVAVEGPGLGIAPPGASDGLELSHGP